MVCIYILLYFSKKCEAANPNWKGLPTSICSSVHIVQPIRFFIHESREPGIEPRGNPTKTIDMGNINRFFHASIFTTVYAKWADDKLIFLSEKEWHLMQIVLIGDKLREILNPVSLENISKCLLLKIYPGVLSITGFRGIQIYYFQRDPANL